jgi:hypothetical protein
MDAPTAQKAITTTINFNTGMVLARIYMPPGSPLVVQPVLALLVQLPLSPA